MSASTSYKILAVPMSEVSCLGYTPPACDLRSLQSMLSILSVTGFAGCHLAQRLTASRLPYTANGRILVSGVVASALAYRVTQIRVENCQNAWMAAEDKHTALNPISERVTQETQGKEE